MHIKEGPKNVSERSRAYWVHRMKRVPIWINLMEDDSKILKITLYKSYIRMSWMLMFYSPQNRRESSVRFSSEFLKKFTHKLPVNPLFKNIFFLQRCNLSPELNLDK